MRRLELKSPVRLAPRASATIARTVALLAVLSLSPGIPPVPANESPSVLTPPAGGRAWAVPGDPGRRVRAAGPAEDATLPRDLVWHGARPAEPTIRGRDSPLERRYLAQYASPGGRQWLETVMTRGQPYLPFIRREVERRGLPPELAYLPVLESAYLPTAVSKSGAVGLWQFMSNSIAPFGLRVDDWVDERRDFWKSTDAALRKLEENHRYFGDWPLALAAYNAGLGAVDRAVKKAGTKDYWVLCEKKLLKPETIQYVPKFIALSRVLNRAGSYGLDLGWPESVEWVRVPVGRTVDLGLLAQTAGLDAALLKRANPELRYAVTPPGPDYRLKVRREDEAKVSATLADKAAKLVKYYFHTIRSGDTLSALSRHYGVGVEQILNVNPGLKARYLQLGARIVVPAFKEVGPYERERSAAPALSFDGTHLVKKGETLWAIALAYDVDPEALAQANGMDLSTILREGKVLKTPILKAGGPL